MDKKPKASGAKKKARPEKAKKDQEQFERFIETARLLDAERANCDFDAIFEKITKERPLSK